MIICFILARYIGHLLKVPRNVPWKRKDLNIELNLSSITIVVNCFLLKAFYDTEISNSQFLALTINNLPIFHMQYSVAHLRQFFIVGDD